MARTERESDRRRRDEKWQTLCCCRDQQKACRMAHALLKRKELPQCHKRNGWQVRRRRPCQKEKEQSRQFKAPDHEGERVKVSESRTLARERSIRARV